MIRVHQIDHVAITVADLARSEAWYREHLGLERRYADLWDGAPVMMGAGDTCVALFPAERRTETAVHAIRMLHLELTTHDAL